MKIKVHYIKKQERAKKMQTSDISSAIDAFMSPTVFTGVKPILLVAEELVTDKSMGSIVEAVWVNLDSSEEFSYISKLAVKGKIFLKKYYKQKEIEAFSGRLALAQKDNLKYVVMHKSMLQEIKDLKSKRNAVVNQVKRGFSKFSELYLANKELYLFEKSDTAWETDLFTSFNINTPYKVLKLAEQESDFEMHLENSKTGKVQKHTSFNDFYGYFLGSMADIVGLRMQNESHLKNISSLQDKAKGIIKKIDWLDLDDTTLQEVVNNLPKHPFENYFKYVKKENLRHIDISDERVNSLKGIILEYMPESNSPIGLEYISIDRLLHLFHEIIPRAEALKALRSCDIIYEAPAIILGFDGKHQSAPKYLVPISHVASAYKQFPAFIKVCEGVEI